MAVGLAVGLVIGAERGSHVRDAPEGIRVAGIWTFVLFGLTRSPVAVLGTTPCPSWQEPWRSAWWGLSLPCER
jgi:hypothetical protein